MKPYGLDRKDVLCCPGHSPYGGCGADRSVKRKSRKRQRRLDRLARRRHRVETRRIVNGETHAED